jgi:protein-S-isoprenylcysteine O-methyltransferase Ste14
MPTKEQFAREQRVCRVQMSVAAVGITVIWAVVLTGASAPLGSWFRLHPIAEAGGVVVALVLLALCYALAAKVLHRHHGLVCPSCGDWMGAQHVMLKTGRCPRCETEMFQKS